MTGTAVAVGEQLREFYGLEVAVIPPNRPCIREDEPDRLYQHVEDKEGGAVVGAVAAAHEGGRPVLLGTLDVAESERLAARLVLDGLPCVVLNAKNDAEEAAIVAEAGGRGRDHRVHPDGRAGHRHPAGRQGPATTARSPSWAGCWVIGVGRHASSRLDDQLRGRAGRQGDPGGSVFFLSLDDELITTCAPDAAWPRRTDADGLVGPTPRRTGQSAMPSGWPRALRCRSTGTPGGTTCWSRTSGGPCCEYRDQVLHSDAALRELAASGPDRVRGSCAPPACPRTCWPGRPGRSGLSVPGPGLGRAPGPRRPTCARASTCARSEAAATRSAGSLVPVQEFNRELTELFSRFTAVVSERTSAGAFQAAEITSSGADLAGAGLKRPSATWTYVVQENPFGTDFGRAVQAISRFLGHR